jgi:hypothetical protein
MLTLEVAIGAEGVYATLRLQEERNKMKVSIAIVSR